MNEKNGNFYFMKTQQIKKALSFIDFEKLSKKGIFNRKYQNLQNCLCEFHFEYVTFNEDFVVKNTKIKKHINKEKIDLFQKFYFNLNTKIICF